MIEIRRVANGYVLQPIMDFRKGEMRADCEVYVFNNYQQMTDKLFELLNPGMPNQNTMKEPK